MIRNLKALGLAFVAVFAMSAVAAAGAQAAEEFHSEVEHTAIESTTSSTQIFEATTGGVQVVCDELEAAGEQSSATAPWVTVGINYETCQIKGQATGSTNVNDNDCHYKLYAATTNEHAKVDLICDTGALEIETNLGVTIDIPNQTIAEAVHYEEETNAGGKKAINVVATAEDNIEYECTGGAFLCEVLAGIPVNGTEASYFGEVTVDGYEAEGTNATGPPHGAGTVDIWKE